MNYIYTNKNKAITDLLNLCRNTKTLRKEYYITKFRLNNEFWTVEIFNKNNNEISTKFILDYKDTSIFYPVTKWGGDYKRWDSELKEFCEREFLKGEN